MLYNVIGYSNEVIGQVEASDVVEAWSEAGKRFDNVLDVRSFLDWSYYNKIKSISNGMPEVKEVYIFGSYARYLLEVAIPGLRVWRGPDSDIDIILYFGEIGDIEAEKKYVDISLGMPEIEEVEVRGSRETLERDLILNIGSIIRVK